MPAFARFARPHISRHARRRVMGFVLLALFARQSTALGWSGCSEAGPIPVSARGASADGMDDMATMAHGHNDAGSDSQPAPDHNSGCDHSIPVGACGFGIGCAIAMLGTTAVITETTATPAKAVGLRAPTRPLSVEFAPDTPPPRA